MRTTVTLDDDLLAKAVKLTGTQDRSTLLREGLTALIDSLPGGCDLPLRRCARF